MVSLGNHTNFLLLILKAGCINFRSGSRVGSFDVQVKVMDQDVGGWFYGFGVNGFGVKSPFDLFVQIRNF